MPPPISHFRLNHFRLFRKSFALSPCIFSQGSLTSQDHKKRLSMLEDFKLKVFLAVARKGSFTLAAKDLGISQPAVSQNIAELERLAGAQLFTRSRGSVTLTGAGTAFKEYAERISYWCSATDRMFGPEGRLTASRRFTIAADDFTAGSILPTLLAKILAVNPSASFNVINPEVSGPEADIRLFHKPDTEELSFEESGTLLTSVQAIALGSDTAYSQTEDLRKLPGRVSLAVHPTYSEMLPADLAARVRVVADSAALTALALQSPDIVAVLPCPPVPTGLVRLPVDLPFLTMDIHLEENPSAASTTLAGLLREAAAVL